MGLPSEMTSRDRFMRAMRNEEVDRPPVWLMRQAGRYMPEYRAIKEKYDFETMCRTPDVAAEISLLPLRAFGPDAVIIFNDILIPLDSMGRHIVYGDDGGPKVDAPVRDENDVRSLRVAEFTPDEPVARTMSMLRETLGKETALLGFAGAPFTMVSYLVESQMTREVVQTRRFMYEQPALFDALLEKITETVIQYLIVQIEAGADAVQLFDSWAGVLPQSEYAAHVFPYQKRVVDGVKHLGKPVILFVNGTANVLPYLAETGADAISVDWRLPMGQVRKALGDTIPLQGNLDPMALFAPTDALRKHIHAVTEQVDPYRGYIFNLGHGILPGTPYENVRFLFEEVRAMCHASV